MINIFVLVTILGHLPVILSAKSKGSENMEQILIVEDDSFLNLSQNLTRLRKEKKITQEELAEFVGVTKASVSKWETGVSHS